MNEYDHPEMSYRRGYEQGAYELFDKIDAFLSVAAIGNQVRDWLREIHKWRVENLRDEAFARDRGTPEPTAAPPRLRLR